MKKVLWLSLLFFLNPASLLAAAPDSSEYPYFKKIKIPSVSKTVKVKVKIDTEILNKTNSEFKNIQLINEQKEEIPFSLLFNENGKVEKITSLETSSKKNTNPLNLVDDNPFSSFSFDEKEDFKDASWVLVTLPELTDIHQIKIIPKNSAIIKSIEIKGGTRSDNLKKLISKRNFSQIINLNTKPVKYLKISFWGSSVKIDDLYFFKNQTASIFFEAKPGNSYKILYGNPLLNSKRYTEKLEKEPAIEINGTLENQKENPLFPKDYDNDLKENFLDNCVFIKNPKQKDSDQDRIGDVCDNAINIKNYDQADLDNDGVGDVKDNCKKINNPNQTDSDQDGIGDACDDINRKETTTETKGNLLKTITIILFFLGIGGFSTFYFRKKQQS